MPDFGEEWADDWRRIRRQDGYLFFGTSGRYLEASFVFLLFPNIDISLPLSSLTSFKMFQMVFTSKALICNHPASNRELLSVHGEILKASTGKVSSSAN